MDSPRLTGDGMAAIYFRAEDLARRTVDYHRVREAEHRSRERFGRRFQPFPWSESVAAVLSDEALEDEESVVALIRELGRQGNSEVALAALDLVVSRGSPAPTKAMFDAAILVCATEYQDQRCVQQFRRMRSLGLQPDLGTANLVLTGVCCRGRLEAAMELMGEMRAQLGIRPNTYSVLLVLQACNFKRRGAYREAIEAVQALEAGGRTANEEVIEALLQVCEAAMQRAPSFEAARAVFAALEQLHLADSTRVYNGLLGAAGRAGRWREAQALYAQMQEDEVPPSLETHTALIQACVVGRALDHALHIFEHLVGGRSANEAVPASIATYNHLIHACHQAGMLEKALEIASWVQKTGVKFDDETYGELMATIDVAQLWDDKAMKQARQHHKPVLPGNLRPAPYDAMRVMYLDHLESLQQEELLALEKLGGLGSWASKSLTRGSVAPPWSGGGPVQGPGRGGSASPGFSSIASSARSLARAVNGPGPYHQATATATATASLGSAATSNGFDGESGYGYGHGFAPGRGGGGGGMLSASAPFPAGSLAGAAASWAPVSTGGGPPGAGAGPPGLGATSSRSVSPAPPPGAGAGPPSHGLLGAGPHAGVPHAWTASSTKSLLKSSSTRMFPGGPGLGPGTSGALVGGVSSRSLGGAAHGPPAAGAPTGFHEPPTWAQLQTLDAVTAGPGGTPFSAAAAAALAAAVAAAQGGQAGSGDGSDPLAAAAAAAFSAMPLSLTVEPSNPLYGQPSSASLAGVGTSRTSMRSITATGAAGGGGGGGGGGGAGHGDPAMLRVALPASSATGGGGATLPPLGGGEAVSPQAGGAIPAMMAATPGLQSLLLGSPNSPRPPGVAAATAAAAAATGGGPNRQRSRVAGALLGHTGGAPGLADGALAGALAAGAADFVPSPLPVLSSMSLSAVSVPGGGPSRRYMATAMGAK